MSKSASSNTWQCASCAWSAKKNCTREETTDYIRREREGVILCFIGPPGVGKTSLGQSIARSLGASLCACRWAASTTKPRSAVTAAPISAPCPAASCSAAPGGHAQPGLYAG
jgi:hypothetical protein